MLQKSSLAILAAGIVLAASSAAEAATLPVNCTTNAESGYLASQLVGVTQGTTIQITGSCLGNVTVATSGLSFINSSGAGATEPGSDGIAGQLEINGATGITINGLTLSGAASDQPGVVYADLWVHDGGAAVVSATAIQGGQRDGILASGAATVAVNYGFVGGQSSITGNGLANIAGANSQVTAETGAHVRLGNPNTNGTPVSNPMYSPMQITGTIGNGITVRQGGSLSAYNVGVIVGSTNSGGTPGTALSVTEGGQAHIEDGVLSGGLGAVVLRGSSTASLQYSGLYGGILVAGASSLVLMQNLANDSGAETAGATLEVTDSSSAIMGGGNDIVSSAMALEIDHGSSLQQRPGSFFGASAATDQIQGEATIQTQSTVELGAGLVGDMPSLSWTGTAMVSQNSSIRLSGGVSLTGSITLSQASNGFFNITSGGGNVVTGGVSCPYTTTATAHTAGNNFVVVATGSSTSAVATGNASPGCLGF